MEQMIVVDLETTGLDPQKDKIIEIGAVRLENGQITDTFSKMVCPKVAIPPRITEITGIDNAMVEHAETIECVFKEFLEFAGKDVLLGHNLGFDYSFLKVNADNLGKNFERNGIDTLQLCRKLLPQLSSKNLETVSTYYDIENPCAHRAYEDAWTTAQLYLKLKENFGEKEEKLFLPRQLQYKIKKQEPITKKQKNYLIDLIKYHKIQDRVLIQKQEEFDENFLDKKLDAMTKSQASKKIDEIILNYGRIPYRR